MTTRRSPVLSVVLMLLGFASLGVIVFGFGSILFVRHLEGLVLEQTLKLAERRGILLEPPKLALHLEHAVFGELRFTLVGLPEVRGRVASATLHYPGFTPKRLTLRQVAVEIKGEPESLLPRLLAFQARNATVPSGLALEVPGVELDFTDTTGRLGTLRGREVRLTQRGEDTVLSMSRFESTWLRTDALTLRISPHAQGFLVVLGDEPTRAPLRLLVHEDKERTRVELSWPKLRVDEVAAALQLPPVPAMLRTVAGSGVLTVDVPKRAASITGHLALQVEGVVVPHPPELAGFDFGKSLQIVSNFSVDREVSQAELSAVKLSAGAFTLRGHGRLRRKGWTVGAQLDLGTRLSCSELAAGLAATHLGAEVGAWARRNARRAVSGAVDVRVQLEADSTRLEQAKVVRRLGIGCGLRPMSLEELLEFELPPLPDAAHVENLVHGALSGTLPSLPVPWPNVTLPTLTPREQKPPTR